jgi:mercuric ion transport protein
MKIENLSNAGTIFASFLAASCCLGPAVFVVFGTTVGFLGKFAVFEALRPYLLAAAILLLGYSFWRLFLAKPDCSCKADIRARKIARGVWWVGLASLVFAASFRQIVLWVYGG